MTIVESTKDRMVLQSGSFLGKTKLILDKKAGRGSLESSNIAWRGKPREFDLAEIAIVDVLTIKDALSGADTHTAALRTRAGEVIAVPAGETEAVQTAERLREFLGLKT
jgi:hypothetical protein